MKQSLGFIGKLLIGTCLMCVALYPIHCEMRKYPEALSKKTRENREILEKHGYEVKIMCIYTSEIMVEFKDGHRHLISPTNWRLAFRGETWFVMVDMSGEIIIHERVVEKK